MIFYNTASGERAVGAGALSTSPGPLAAGFLVTHFEERQDGTWGTGVGGGGRHTPIPPLPQLLGPNPESASPPAGRQSQEQWASGAVGGGGGELNQESQMKKAASFPKGGPCGIPTGFGVKKRLRCVISAFDAALLGTTPECQEALPFSERM